MSRDLTAGMSAAALADQICLPTILVKLEFDSGDVLLHTAVGDITYAGDVYTGVGTLGNISPVTEDIEGGANGVTLTLSGLSNSILSIALGESFQNRPATLFFALFDTSTYALITDPYQLFKGRMDYAEGNFGNDASITLKVENIMADWQRPRVGRYNYESQLQRFPGDKGFEFIAQAVAKPVVWGTE